MFLTYNVKAIVQAFYPENKFTDNFFDHIKKYSPDVKYSITGELCEISNIANASLFIAAIQEISGNNQPLIIHKLSSSTKLIDGKIPVRIRIAVIYN